MAWSSFIQEHVSDGSVCHSSRADNFDYPIRIRSGLLLGSDSDLQRLSDARIHNSIYNAASVVPDLRLRRFSRKG